MNFVLMADELYKKGIDGSLLRCLGRDDQNITLGEVHNGICGAHQAGKKMKWVLYHNHVYWPSMIKDCIDYAKACQECQKHGSIQQIPASELHSIIKPWPFRGWGLDLIGLIYPLSSKQHNFSSRSPSNLMWWWSSSFSSSFVCSFWRVFSNSCSNSSLLDVFKGASIY